MNINYEVKNRIATVTFNRPEALNALKRKMLEEIDTVISEIDNDPCVDVIVFTGFGKAFIAGADISEMANMTEEEAFEYGKFGSHVFRKIEQIGKPTIAAVNGYCLGGGNELAMACDIRLASYKAKFGQPEVTLGIIAGFTGTQRLPRIIGVAKAKELLFTGKIIDAYEAKEIGLVNQVYESDELLKETCDLAKAMVKNSYYAIKQTKKAIDQGMALPIEDAIEIENKLFAKCFTKKDQKEGMQAFLEKRPAKFNEEV